MSQKGGSESHFQSASDSPKKRFVTKRVGLFSTMLGFTLLFFLIGTSVVTFAYFLPESFIGSLFRKAIPLPVALIDGSIIWYGDLDENRDSLRRFYESQGESLAKNGFRVDFDTPDGKKRLLIREKDILNKLIENKAIEILAERQGIHFSSTDADAGISDAIRTSGGDRSVFEERIRELYNWTISDFRDHIVVPSLYRDALSASFQKELDPKEAKDRIDAAEKVIQSGSSIEEAAKQYSDGDSKERGGDLGWVMVDTLVPELADAARKQTIGVVGPIIESSIGYHIALVIERKTEDGKDLARIEQVFTRKPSFPDWIADKMRMLSIHIFPRRYIWNASEAHVEFRDAALRDFEQKALEKADGDPSLIF